MTPCCRFFNIFTAFFLFACSAPRKTAAPAAAAPANKDLLAGIMQSDTARFSRFLNDSGRYRIQLIYTQIDRDSSNRPAFRHYYYQVDPGKYFYPASTVKLPVAALALQRLRELEAPSVSFSSTMITEKATPWQTAVFNDPAISDGRPTIANYIKKILLVSDNDAFNRLYEFLGQEYINNSLHAMGYDSAQVLHRLQLSLPEAEQRTTNPIRFFDPSGKLLYAQPARRSGMVYQPRKTLLGKAYMSGDQRIMEPFDFSKRNRLTLPELHSILASIIFPEAVPAAQRFRITEEDHRLLWRYMSAKPAESSYPRYDTAYGDNYSKFLLFGGQGKLPAQMRIFNKEGDAYGFLTDAAYVVDFEKGIEFMVSATIYCNADETFNDDQYEYDSVGLPFLRDIGQALYQYELTRPRVNRPDLSKFRTNYTE